MNTELHAQISAAASAIGAHTSRRPRVALILGSGLGAWASSIRDAVAIPYDEIPGFHGSTVTGHAGRLVVGRHRDVDVVAMQGRVHLYEGLSAADVAFPVQVMHALGADTLVVTNAAGGANPSYRPGDLMVIEDHLNLTGMNPLVGPNDERVGPRFPDMSTTYTPALRALAIEVAHSRGLALQRGVYAGLLGPTYETPAEVRMLQTLGADAVGMSTVLEVIAARHAGMRVLGISCITNQAAGLGTEELDHSEVTDVADRVRSAFVGLLDDIVAAIPERSP